MVSLSLIAGVVIGNSLDSNTNKHTISTHTDAYEFNISVESSVCIVPIIIIIVSAHLMRLKYCFQSNHVYTKCSRFILIIWSKYQTNQGQNSREIECVCVYANNGNAMKSVCVCERVSGHRVNIIMNKSTEGCNDPKRLAIWLTFSGIVILLPPPSPTHIDIAQKKGGKIW